MMCLNLHTCICQYVEQCCERVVAAAVLQGDRRAAFPRRHDYDDMYVRRDVGGDRRGVVF